MPWWFVPREWFSDLTGDPLSSRIVVTLTPDQPPAKVGENHQTIQQLERVPLPQSAIQVTPDRVFGTHNLSVNV